MCTFQLQSPHIRVRYGTVSFTWRMVFDVTNQSIGKMNPLDNVDMLLDEFSELESFELDDEMFNWLGQIDLQRDFTVYEQNDAPSVIKDVKNDCFSLIGSKWSKNKCKQIAKQLCIQKYGDHSYSASLTHQPSGFVNELGAEIYLDKDCVLDGMKRWVYPFLTHPWISAVSLPKGLVFRVVDPKDPNQWLNTRGSGLVQFVLYTDAMRFVTFLSTIL